MLKVLRIFFTAEGTRPFLVLFCLLVAGAFEAVSLSALLPAATQISGGASDNSSPLNDTVAEALAMIGLPDSLPVLIGVIVLAMIIKSLLSFLALTYAGYAVAVVSTSIRKRLLRALFAADWAYFTSLQTGKIANAISINATNAGAAYLLAARCVAQFVQGAVYIAVAVFISYKMALAGAIFGGVLVFILSGFVRLGRRAGFKQTDRTGELVEHVTNVLGNLKPIKTMDRQAHFLEYAAGRIRLLKRALVNQAVAREGLYYAQDALSAIAIGIGVYFASTIWKVPLPELVVLGLLFYQAIAIIAKVQKYFQKFAALEGAHDRTHALIADLEGNKEPDPGIKLPALQTGVRFDNVSFSHGDKQIIHAATFDVAAGGITVLQGPSGSGKTTLIDLMIGLHIPSAGQITIDAMPLGQISLANWRSVIGYVPQDLNLLHGSIATNVTMGNDDISRDVVVRALELAGADEFITTLADGIDTDVGEMGAKLSGGQRQRISLARALVYNPKLLILDEVTSALDAETEQAICDQITTLKGDYTIVAITHRPAWTHIATALYKVEDGRVMPDNKQPREKSAAIA